MQRAFESLLLSNYCGYVDDGVFCFHSASSVFKAFPLCTCVVFKAPNSPGWMCVYAAMQLDTLPLMTW